MSVGVMWVLLSLLVTASSGISLSSFRFIMRLDTAGQRNPPGSSLERGACQGRVRKLWLCTIIDQFQHPAFPSQRGVRYWLKAQSPLIKPNKSTPPALEGCTVLLGSVAFVFERESLEYDSSHVAPAKTLQQAVDDHPCRVRM